MLSFAQTSWRLLMSYTGVLWSLATVLLVGAIVIGLVGEPNEGPVSIASNAPLSEARMGQDMAADNSSNVLTARQGRYQVVPSEGQQTSHFRVDSPTAHAREDDDGD
jgi:hypothetical protein